MQMKGFPNHKTVSSGSGSFLNSLGCVVLMKDFSSIVPFSRLDFAGDGHGQLMNKLLICPQSACSMHLLSMK